MKRRFPEPRTWLALLALSCSRQERPPPSAAPEPSAPQVATSSSAASSIRSAEPADQQLPPLSADWLERYELPEGQVVFVAPPVGARTPRPVIVAVHGAGDRPDWACGGWRLGSASFAFVVCPQGTPMRGQRYGWVSERELLLRVEAAQRALRERYGAYVASTPALYAGFSQGANFAGALLVERARDFSAAVFAEGGYETTIDAAWAKRYRAGGGERVLLVCGSPLCFQHAARATRVLEAAGLRAEAAGDARAGHNLNEHMQRALQSAWPRFVDGLAGWQGYPPATPQAPR